MFSKSTLSTFSNISGLQNISQSGRLDTFSQVSGCAPSGSISASAESETRETCLFFSEFRRNCETNSAFLRFIGVASFIFLRPTTAVIHILSRGMNNLQ